MIRQYKDGITEAKYWTELPPKAELNQQLFQVWGESSEQLTGLGVMFEGSKNE